MSDWFIETGIYLLAIAAVPFIGLLLVFWGLWGDRSRGRPRCPKCWYDMRGTVLELSPADRSRGGLCGPSSATVLWSHQPGRPSATIL